MMKCIFFGMTSRGHINPSLEITKKLVETGHKIIYYSSLQYKELIEDTGAVFKPYPMDNIDRAESEKNVFSIFATVIKANIEIYESIREEIKESDPDYIIHDSFLLAGKMIGMELNIPIINSVTTFAFESGVLGDPVVNSDEDKKYYMEFEKTAEYCKANYNFDLDIMDGYSNKEELNIVYTSRYFQINGDNFDETYKFIGPVFNHRSEESTIDFTGLKNKPVVYISLGTVFNRNNDFFNECISCFKETDYNVIISVGKNTDLSVFGDVPDNINLYQFVPQIEVLKNASAFITHGGMNSVAEALYYNVPVIVIAQGGDQFLVAGQVEKLGAGIKINNDEFNSFKLKEALAELFKNSRKYRENAEKIRMSFINAGGADRAVKAILEYV